MSERDWFEKIFHSSPEMEPDLRSRRTVHPETGKLMKHTVSRHCHLGINGLQWPNGGKFGRGTLFPPHVSAGQITKIQKIVLAEYQKHKNNRGNCVVLCQRAGGAERIVVKLCKYGLGEVGGFIRNGSVCTVFPEE